MVFFPFHPGWAWTFQRASTLEHFEVARGRLSPKARLLKRCAQASRAWWVEKALNLTCLEHWRPVKPMLWPAWWTKWHERPSGHGRHWGSAVSLPGDMVAIVVHISHPTLNLMSSNKGDYLLPKKCNLMQCKTEQHDLRSKGTPKYNRPACAQGWGLLYER